MRSKTTGGLQLHDFQGVLSYCSGLFFICKNAKIHCFQLLGGEDLLLPLFSIIVTLQFDFRLLVRRNKTSHDVILGTGKMRGICFFVFLLSFSIL